MKWPPLASWLWLALILWSLGWLLAAAVLLMPRPASAATPVSCSTPAPLAMLTAVQP
jgi:hypothetical protein